jgi:Nif-specific regulatory protein
MINPAEALAAAALPRPFSPRSDRGEIAALIEVTRALSGTLDLSAGLAAVLEVLEQRQGVVRSMVTLIDPTDAAGGELRVAAGLRLTSEGWAARFQLGEGITGTVVKEGRPMAVPRISQEPRFLHRSGTRELEDETSFLCVPVLVDARPVGALGIFLRWDPARDYDAALDLMAVIAAMIGQRTKVSWMVQAERRHLVEENTQLREELLERYECSGLIGGSGAMRHLYTSIAQVAHTNATVLIRGESGTGKELMAHAIHLGSPRAGGPYVTVNCGALPPTLVESELFGHEKGAFTGAHARKVGVFERAHGGTLFLDEIGDFDASLQVKLLRVLQQREVQRVGGTEPVPVDVRVIAATHRDLEQAMAAGRFREDLYYRLNVFSIYAPPLRERKADIMILAEHFVEKYASEYGKEIKRISTPAIDMLTSYHWPGNVRELENAIVRAILVCDSAVIHGHHLPPTLQTAEASDTITRGSLSDLVGTFERDLIEDALKTARGSRAQAARLLKTTERILSYRIRRYGIDCRRFR